MGNAKNHHLVTMTPALDDLLERYQTYYSLFDGRKKSREEVRPVVHALFDQSIAEAQVDADCTLLEMGTKMDVEEVEPKDSGNIVCWIHMSAPDMNLYIASKDKIREGKIVRVDHKIVPQFQR